MAKAEGAATTAEQAAAHVAALETEKLGYQARIAGLKNGGTDRLSAENLASRVSAVDAEIKRVKPAAKKADEDA